MPCLDSDSLQSQKLTQKNTGASLDKIEKQLKKVLGALLLLFLLRLEILITN